MRNVKFSVACNAVYQGELSIPDDIPCTKKATLSYIRNNLNEVAVTDLEWLSDYEDTAEAVMEEDVKDWGFEDTDFDDNLFGVSQYNCGHEYRWIFTAEEIRKQAGFEPVDGAWEDIHWPIGGSNSSATGFTHFANERDIRAFLISGSAPDLEDPELVDIGEYVLTYTGSDNAVTEEWAERFGYDNLLELEQQDDIYRRKKEVKENAIRLANKGCEEIDAADPFYGKSKSMRYSEFEDLCAKYKVNTLKSFTMAFNGFSNRYSRYKVAWSLPWKQDIHVVIDALNDLGIDPESVGDGYQNEDGSVSFKIFKGSPQLIYRITEKLHCIGFADTDWDDTYTVVAKNGQEYNCYNAEWTNGCPYLREEGDCWDAFVTLSDQHTGATFNTGAGAVSKDVYEYYKNMVDTHLMLF